MRHHIDRTDARIAAWMDRLGHPIHHICLGVFFIWVGLLKAFGYKTGSSLLAHTVYIGSPDVMVPLLGWWEVAIGVTLLVRPLVRVSILLMAVRLPGTALALAFKPDVCFSGSPWLPTPEGQYLIKDMMLLGAAMVIGGTVRSKTHADGDDPDDARAVDDEVP